MVASSFTAAVLVPSLIVCQLSWPFAHGASLEGREGEVIFNQSTVSASNDATETVHHVNTTEFVPPEFGDALDVLGTNLKEKNWTTVIASIEDPSNRSYVISCLMIFCFGMTVYGHQQIKLWLFLGGFISVAIAFYLFAPKILAGTDVCCGEGTEKAHVLISVGLGVLAGGIALWILQVGIFLCGTCLGLGVSLGLRTMLAHMSIFQSDVSFALFYTGAALVGGLVALYKNKPIIICVTAFGGSFGFFTGVGYFDDCDFLTIVTHVREEVESEMTPHDVPQCVIFLGFFFFLFAIAGMMLQCGYFNTCLAKLCGPCGSKSAGQDSDRGVPRKRSSRRRHAAYNPLFEKPSHGLDATDTDTDDASELKDLLVKKYIKEEIKKQTKRSLSGKNSGPRGVSRSTSAGARVGEKRRVYRKKTKHLLPPHARDNDDSSDSV
eukprot:m.8133 g.8133  ORF g.8133 m.8133 type:complete len:436 (+) comp6109_c0_seq2:233-1540(+)